MRELKRYVESRSRWVVTGIGALVAAACGGIIELPAEIILTPTELTLLRGATASVSASLSGVKNTEAVVWTSSNQAVATVSGSGSSATVTGVAPGTATITAALSSDASKNRSMAVTVAAPPPAMTAFTLAPAQLSMIAGDSSREFTPQPTLAVGASASYAWLSSNTTVAQVRPNGRIVAIAPGTTTITGTATATGPVLGTTILQASAPVTVGAAPANACTSVSLSPAALSVVQAGTAVLTPTVTRASTSVTAIGTWSTSNPSVATVNNGAVTGVALGTATISLQVVCSGAEFTSNTVVATASVTVAAGSTFAPITTWQYSYVASPLPAAQLSRAWAASASTWFVGGLDNITGAGGGVWRSTNSGVSWTRLPLAGANTIVSVTGTSPTNVYALAIDGGVWRYDGNQFTQLRAPGNFTGDASEISVVGTTVFIAGINGSAARVERSVNNAAFTVMALPSALPMRSITAVSATEVYAAGDSGVVLRYDGVNWTRAFQHPTRATLRRVVAPAPGNVFAGGTDLSAARAVIARLTGGVWSAATPPATGFSDDLTVGAGGVNEVYSYDWPRIVHRFNGTGWTEVSAASGPLWSDARTLIAPAAGVVVAIGSSNASVQTLSAATWSVQSATPDFYTAAVQSPTRMYLGGSFGAIYRFNGSTIGTFVSSVAPYEDVWRLVANGPDDLVATDGSTFFRVTATGVTTIGPSGTASTIQAMAGGNGLPIFAVTSAGYIARLTTTSVTPQSSGVSGDLRTVWVGAPNFAIAGGRNALTRWNGTAWAPFTAPIASSYDVTALWGSSESDMYALVRDAASTPRLFLWNGTAWLEIAVQSALAGGVFGNAAGNGVGDGYATTTAGVSRIGGAGTTQSIVVPVGYTWSSALLALTPYSIAVAPTGGTALAVGLNSAFSYGTASTAFRSSFFANGAEPLGMDASLLYVGSRPFDYSKKRQLLRDEAQRMTTLRGTAPSARR